MKLHYRNFSIITIMLVLCGCSDVSVESVNVTSWDEDNKTAVAVIRNKSFFSAGEFMVYFDGDENPVSQNHRPQVTHKVNSLAGGASIELTADFIPLAHPDNHQLANIYQITVRADPKNQVRESNEDNNVKSAPTPTGSTANVVAHNLVPEGNWVISSLDQVKQTFLTTAGGTLAGVELALLRCTASSPIEFIVEFGQGGTALATESMAANDMPGLNQCGVTPPALDMASTGPGYFDFSSHNITLQAGQEYYIRAYGNIDSQMRAGLNLNQYNDGSAEHNGNPAIHDLVFKVLAN